MKTTKKNESQCSCCGQMRPFPTEPGEWEYSQNANWDNPTWQSVTVKLPLKNDRDGGDGLRLWQDGNLVWWPCNCAWRKIK